MHAAGLGLTTGDPTAAHSQIEARGGYTYVSLTLVSWTASNALIQEAVAPSYTKMIAVSVLGNLPSLCLTLLYVKQVPPHFREYLIYAFPMAIIALISSVTFNKSLQYTLQSTTNVVSSTTIVFTLFFELILLNESFSSLPFLAGITSLIGCAIVANDIPEAVPISPNQVYHHDLGIFLALISAVSSALFSVLIRLYSIRDTTLFQPCMAAVTVALSPLLLTSMDVLSVEKFSWPNGVVLFWIMANGILSLLSNFWQMRSINILSPFVSNMFMSLSIPLSIICDCFIRKINVSVQFAIGTIIVVGSTIFVAGLPRKTREEGTETEPLTNQQ